jgi:hypothetical protein
MDGDRQGSFIKNHKISLKREFDATSNFIVIFFLVKITSNLDSKHEYLWNLPV